MRARQRVSSGGRWEPIVGYSRAVRVGDTAWVSGCTAAGPDGSVAGRGDAYAQTVQAIRTMADALARLGLGLDRVVRTGVYLADMRDWEAIARAHREAFGEIRPACTWIECGTMIHPDMLVEIDAIAVE
jgi:enamine deaminase RidA (YjgF/YER057c/UK114 family)